MVAVLAKEMTCTGGRGNVNSGTGMVHSDRLMDWPSIISLLPPSAHWLTHV